MLRSILIRGGILSCLLCTNTFAQILDGPTTGRKAVFGKVSSMDLEKRILTFTTDAGEQMKVRIADDVDFRRLDGKPNKLETLEKDHKIRVEYEPSDDGIPIVKNLRARVLQPPGDSPPTKAVDQKPVPAGRGTFEALKRYSPRRAIVDAPFLKASEVTDQVTDNELVLGVEIKGKARAYPINMLTGPPREIINDTGFEPRHRQQRHIRHLDNSSSRSGLRAQNNGVPATEFAA